MENTFSMVAKTFQGLEDVLRDELISLGAENVEMGRRMVSFEGDLALMYRANLCCRTALRILKPIEKFTASDPDELYDIVRDIEWEKYMTPQTTFAIDSTVNSDDFTHSKFVTYRVKDGIVDHFRDKTGERPSIRVTGAERIFNVHISDNRVTISLDSSGEPLSKRGYRVEQTEAPINEVLAAGIIMKTGWRGDSNFADPMCGSGTFLIEAALIAANINPGIYRENFAFESWDDFDEELFNDIYNDDSAERDFDFKIYGGDIDPDAVGIARRNIREAKVEDMIELTCRPMSDWTDNPEPGILVMNPPYGQRLKPEDMTELYRGIGSCLKKNFQGWHAWIIGLNEDDFANIGLKPSMKIPMLNGSLECQLREYVLFDGRYNDFRADGGNVSRYSDDDDFEERGPRKMRRQSDEEWRAETRKFGGHKEYAKKKDFERGGKRDFGSNRKGGYDRGFDDDDAGFSRKPSFDRDRKPSFDRDRKASFDRDRKPGGSRDRNERREYGENRGGFRRDGKPGGSRDRNERRDYGENRGGFRRDGKPGGSRDRNERRDYGENRGAYFSRPAREVVPQKPKISEDRAQVFSNTRMRSRKPKQEDEV